MQPNLSRRQARWSEFPQRFGAFEWKYRKGAKNVADALSQSTGQLWCNLSRRNFAAFCVQNWRKNRGKMEPRLHRRPAKAVGRIFQPWHKIARKMAQIVHASTIIDFPTIERWFWASCASIDSMALVLRASSLTPTGPSMYAVRTVNFYISSMSKLTVFTRVFLIDGQPASAAVPGTLYTMYLLYLGRGGAVHRTSQCAPWVPTYHIIHRVPRTLGG
jgi:hypothetical protein